jgi:large repetitive protein
MLGNGDGTFQPAVVAPAGPFVGGCCVANGVAAGDFNGDGRPDVAVLGLYNSATVMLGNGDGTLQPGVQYIVGTGRNFAMAIGDFNRDGKLDLAAGSGDSIGILLNIRQ